AASVRRGAAETFGEEPAMSRLAVSTGLPPDTGCPQDEPCLLSAKRACERKLQAGRKQGTTHHDESVKGITDCSIRLLRRLCQVLARPRRFVEWLVPRWRRPH